MFGARGLPALLNSVVIPTPYSVREWCRFFRKVSRLPSKSDCFLKLSKLLFRSRVASIFFVKCHVCLVKVTGFIVCHLISCVTINSAAEGCQLSALPVWWPGLVRKKTRKRLQRGFNIVYLLHACVALRHLIFFATSNFGAEGCQFSALLVW